MDFFIGFISCLALVTVIFAIVAAIKLHLSEGDGCDEVVEEVVEALKEKEKNT